MIDNKYFHWYYENPLKTYEKIKTYFLPLKTKWSFSFGKGNGAKIFDFSCFDLTWKDKWNSPRHEFNPRIKISLFNRLHLLITYTVGDSMTDMVYWEVALWWLYYRKTLASSICNSTGWTQYNKETDMYESMEFTVLKEPWNTKFKTKTLPRIIYDGRT